MSDFLAPDLQQYLSSVTPTSGLLEAPTTGLVPTYTPSFSLSGLGAGGGDLGVIQQNLPAAVESYNTKYAEGNQLQSALTSPTYAALKAYDTMRLQKGQSPLSESITADVAQAAETGQSVAPEPTTMNPITNAYEDLKKLISGVPAIPGQVVKEFQHAYELPQKIAKIQQDTKGDVRQQLAQYLQLPIANLVPGTYTASNVIGGNFGELAQHPLMTALDVLPYAEAGAKATKVAKVADEAAIARAAEETRLGGVPREPKSNPIAAVLTKKVTPEGTLAPNLLGQGLQTAKEAVGTTTLGQLMQDAWSDTARFGSRIWANEQEAFRNALNPKGRVSEDPIVQWTREANDLPNKYSDLDPVRREQIDKNMMDPVNNPALDDLTDTELAYQSDVRDLTARAKSALDTDGDLASRYWGNREEIFTKQEAARLDRVQAMRDSYEQAFNKKLSLQQKLRDWKNPNLHSKTETINLLGEEIGTTDNSISSQNVEALRQKLAPLRRTDPVANRFLVALKQERYANAIGELRGMKGKKWDDLLSDIDAEGVVSELQNAKGFQKELNTPQMKRISERGLASRIQRAESIRKSITPARFTPMRDAFLKQNLENIIGGFDDPGLANWMDYLDNNGIASLADKGVIDQGAYISALRDAQETVAKLQAEGVDPVFLHKVRPDEAMRSYIPSLSDVKTTPSWTKQRGIELSPQTSDYQVALSHQGMEKLKQIHTENAIDTFAQAFGKKYTELYDQFFQDALTLKQQNPNLDVQTYIDRQIKKAGYTRFDTNAYTPWKKQPSSAFKAAEDIYVPTTIANNLRRVMEGPGKLISSFDPLMKAFRTSVLALSLRWLTNNVFGGLFNSLAETSNPLALFKNMGEAWKMAKSGELENIEGLRGRGATDIAPEDVEWLSNKVKDMTGAQRGEVISKMRGGAMIRRLIDSDPASTLFKGANKLVAGSYKINQLFDDMYRATTYLTERDSALKKGLSQSEAEAKGIAIGRRIMQNWDELTPLERTGLRFVLPFYGFMQHMIRFAGRYPFDHPIRTSILGSFARNELADMGTGLPQQFQSMMFLGSPDEQGNQKAINLTGANPFAVVGDSFTLAGLLGQSNPVVSTLAETLGLDPVTGTTDLYPNVSYDPESGKLVAAQGNFASNLLGNTIPYANILGALNPTNKEFQNLLATNPEAAGRQLFANAGIPLLARNVNRPTEIIKAEKNRIQNQQNVKSAAMKTGNYSEAQNYPALAAWVQQMQTLNSQGQLETYKPIQTQAANPALALLSSVQGSAPPAQAAYNNQILALGG